MFSQPSLGVHLVKFARRCGSHRPPKSWQGYNISDSVITHSVVNVMLSTDMWIVFVSNAWYVVPLQSLSIPDPKEPNSRSK